MNGKRGPYSSPRQQSRRVRILHAAGEQLEKHGFAALTMQSIAEVSDVSTKTLYNLFGSRELLLLEAASERLAELEESPIVEQEEAGIPRLLAFTSGTILQFEQMPDLARAILSILVQADLDPDTAYRRMGPVQRFAHTSLFIAAEQGELREGLDLVQISYIIAENEWGGVLLWEKGILQLDQLHLHIDLNHCLTLAPLCIGKRKKWMQDKLETLLSRMAASSSTLPHEPQKTIRLVAKTKKGTKSKKHDA